MGRRSNMENYLNSSGKSWESREKKSRHVACRAPLGVDLGDLARHSARCPNEDPGLGRVVVYT